MGFISHVETVSRARPHTLLPHRRALRAHGKRLSKNTGDTSAVSSDYSSCPLFLLWTTPATGQASITEWWLTRIPALFAYHAMTKSHEIWFVFATKEPHFMCSICDYVARGYYTGQHWARIHSEGRIQAALLLASIGKLTSRWYPRPRWVCNIHLLCFITTRMWGKGQRNVKLLNLELGII